MAPPSARQAIEALLHPRTVAVVGATVRAGYGGRLMANLLERGFAGRVVPVNPNRATVMDLPCYPSVRDVPGQVDLAAIVIPAPDVARILGDCAAAAVPAALVISAGFAEAAGPGAALQDVVAGVASLYGPRVCGPNCLGVGNLATGLWASANVLAPADERLKLGGIALVSQSGATVFGPLLALARDRGIGLRYVVSSGNEADLTTADFIDYFVADRGVTAIALVLEGIRDGAAFRRAIEAGLAADKPIVVLKLGRSAAGAAAALTHTAAMTGEDDVFDAFVRQHGLARVDDWDQLLETVDALARAKRPTGRRVGVISHSGGIAGLLADACETRGLTVRSLEPDTEAGLAAILDGRGAARNPADITGHYDRETFAEILRLVADDPAVDALAVATAGAPHVAARLAAAATATAKPVLACWTGGLEETEGLRILRESTVPVVYQPSDCATVLAALASWTEARRRQASRAPRSHDPRAWAKLTDAIGRFGALPLPESIGLALLRDAGIPVTPSIAVAFGSDKAPLPAELTARVHAASLVYPLAVKIDSPDLPHKSDVGGVRLGVRDGAELAAAAIEVARVARAAEPTARIRGITVAAMVDPGVEVVLGLHHDPQLGPTLLVGLGGVLTDAIRARAWRLLPICADDADALIDEVPGLGRLLLGVRGRPPADRAALRDAILSFAGWANDTAGSLASAEINPLIVLPTGLGAVAIDCLLVPRLIA